MVRPRVGIWRSCRVELEVIHMKQEEVPTPRRPSRRARTPRVIRPPTAGRCSRSTSLPRRCSPAPRTRPQSSSEGYGWPDIPLRPAVHGRLDGRELGRVQVIEAPSQAPEPRGAAARQPGRGLDLPSRRPIRAGAARAPRNAGSGEQRGQGARAQRCARSRPRRLFLGSLRHVGLEAWASLKSYRQAAITMLKRSTSGRATAPRSGTARRTPPHPPNSPAARHPAPSSFDRWIRSKPPDPIKRRHAGKGTVNIDHLVVEFEAPGESVDHCESNQG